MQRILLASLLLTGMLAGGCNDDDDPPAPAGNGGGGGGGGTTTITATTVESVTYTLDGTTHTYTAGANNVEIVFGNSGSTGSPISTKVYGCGFYNSVTEVEHLNIDLGKFEMTGMGIPDADEFFGWFGTGAVAYGNTDTEVEKARITMNDGPPLYTQWSSHCGAQSGATFNITQVVEIPSSIQYDRVKYRVTFNCKLYNCVGGGAERTITNGVAVVSCESNI